jgi:plasmid stabilization system protein ParE
MTRRIITARFRSDTNYILDYLDRVAGPRVTEDYASRFRATIDRLIQFPRSGSPRPLLGGMTRAARVSPYLLIYDYNLEDDAIVLLRILHESRNITAELVRPE